MFLLNILYEPRTGRESLSERLKTVVMLAHICLWGTLLFFCSVHLLPAAALLSLMSAFGVCGVLRLFWERWSV